jgi:hypothetical protein
MPLQIRRGTTAQRLTITPLPGELIHDTTTGQIFVGDGTTVGGFVTTGLNLEQVRDTAASLFTTGVHSGISFSYNDELDRINATVSISSEEVRDAAASLLTTGVHSGISFSYNDELDRIDATVTVATDAEQVRDTAASLFTTGVHSGISFSYNDELDRIDATVAAGLSLEEVRDAAASLFTTGVHSGISFSYNDELDKIDATVSISSEEVRDAAASLFTTGVHSGISFSYNDELDRIDATVTVESRGPFDGDLTGSVFADDSTKLVDGVNGRLVGPLATSGLAANLNTNNFTITSNVNSDVTISPSGNGRLRIVGDTDLTGNISKTGVLVIRSSVLTQLGDDTSNDGNLIITRNSYSNTPGAGFLFKQHHDNQDAVNFSFFRTRGTSLSQTALQDGDDIAELLFTGLSPGSPFPTGGIALTITVDGTPTTGRVPAKLQFGTDNGSGTAFRAELSAQGVWKVNTIQGLTDTLSITGNLSGDVTGSIFTDNSTRILDGTNGRITTPSVTLSEFLKLPVYANDTARDAAIPTPEKGMVIMIESGSSPVATNQIEFFNGTIWVTL